MVMATPTSFPTTGMPEGDRLLDDNHLRMHAESLALRQLLFQIAELVDQRHAETISEEGFFEAVKERCNVHRHLKIPQLQKIIDMLEKL